MKVQDIISCPGNDPETIVSVRGQNPSDSCDPMSPEYYHGKLGEIPNELKNCNLDLERSLKHNNSGQSQTKKPHML